MLHVVLGICCIAFGVLWIRALGRVRRNIVQRTGIARHVAQVFESLSFEQSVVVTHNVITFQVKATHHRGARVFLYAFLPPPSPPPRPNVLSTTWW